MQNEDQIRQIVQDELKNDKSIVGPLAVPYHTHSGNSSDGPMIEPLIGLKNVQRYFYTNEIVLTPNQIKALHTTPITLVASQLTNSFIVVEGISLKNNFNSVAFTGANNLEFRYTDASGIKVTADIANTFINSASTAYAHVAGIITAFTPVTAAPIVVTVPTANPGAGNGSIAIIIKYRVITF